MILTEDLLEAFILRNMGSHYHLNKSQYYTSESGMVESGINQIDDITIIMKSLELTIDGARACANDSHNWKEKTTSIFLVKK